MPIRGENIGTAYVRIVGDGSGLPDDVRDAFEDSEPSVREAGRNHGQIYGKSYKSAFGKTQKEMLDDLNTNLNQSLARQDLSNSFFRSRGWKQFRKRLEVEGGAAGSLWGRKLEQSFRDSGAIDRLADSMDSFGPEMRRAQKEILTELHTEALRMNRQYDDAVKKQREDMDRDFEMRHRQMSDAHRDMLDEAYFLDKQYDAKRKRMLDEAYRENKDYNLRLQRLIRTTSQDMGFLNREVSQLVAGDSRATPKRDLQRILRENISAIEKNHDALERAGYRTKVWTEALYDHQRAVDGVNPRLQRMIGTTDRWSDRVGLAFGRGSRNDFIHFAGSLARGLTRLALGVFPRVLNGLTNLVTGFRNASGVAGKFGFALGKIGSTVGIAGGALAGLVVIIGPLVAMLSLAAGAVIALASTLGMALVGAIGAVAGSFVPFAAGLGVLIVGFKNLEGEAKTAAKGVKDAFKDLGEFAGSSLSKQTGFVESLNSIEKMVRSLQPVVREVTQGLARGFENFTEAAAGPLRKFISAVTEGGEKMSWMERQVARIGDTLGNAFGGMLGFFRGLMPSIDRFTGWIRDLSREFNAWANSVKGQQSIRKFFDDAVDSARNFGSFLSGVWDLLGRVITLGNEAGDSMFKSLGDKARELTDYLNTPQGAAAFRGWMNDAREFAESLGRLFLGVMKFVDALDNQLTRAIANSQIELLTSAFKLLAVPIEFVADQLSNLKDALDDVTGSFDLGSKGASFLGGAIKSMALGPALGPLSSAQAMFSNFGRSAEDAGGSTLGFGAALEEALRGGMDAATDFSGAYNNAMESVERASVLARLGQENLIVSGNKLGIATRDLIDAALGNRNAQERVNDALRGGGPAAEEFRNKLGGLRGEMRGHQEMIRTYENNLKSWKEALQGVPKSVRTEIKQLGFKPALREIMQLQREHKLTPKQLRIAMEAVGYKPTQRQIRILTKDVKGIPNRIETKIENRGFPKTMKELQKLFHQQKATKEEIRTTVKALGVEKAWAAFRKVQVEADKTGNKKPQPKVDVITALFDKGMKNVNTAINNFGRLHKIARVSVDPTNSYSVMQSLISRLQSINSKTINIHTNYTSSGKVPKTASGTLANYPQVRMIGEAGPEAVVPLRRPLGQVDPAVRWLSAIAQGKVPGMATGGVVGAGKTVNVAEGAFQIITPTTDPRAVAIETVNRLVAVGY